MVLVKKGTNSVQCSLNYELLFELNEENIGHMKRYWTYFPSKSGTGIVLHRISKCRPVVGSGLDTLVWEGPIRNGVGQVGIGLGHVRP